MGSCTSFRKSTGEKKDKGWDKSGKVAGRNIKASKRCGRREDTGVFQISVVHKVSPTVVGGSCWLSVLDKGRYVISFLLSSLLG